MSQPPIDLWGVEAPLEPLAGGHRNTVWRTNGLPQERVFKSTQRAEAAVAWLNDVQSIARVAGLNVPKMHRSLSGDWIGAGWVCEDFVEGEAIVPSESMDLVQPLSRFHVMTRDLPQRPGFLSTFELMTQDSGGDVDLTLMPPEVVMLCRTAWEGVQAMQPCVVHCDIAVGNLLRGPDGRCWLIDWDESRRDIPIFDFIALKDGDAAARQAHLAWEIACCWKREPERARALVQDLRTV